MALPLISTLNATARAALPLIRGGVAQGLSSRAISETIKASFGKSIRRSTLLQIIRAEKGIVEAGAQLKFLPKLSRPDLNRLPHAMTRIRRNFSFVVRVTGTLIDVGTKVTQNITISSNTILTRANLEQLAIDTIINDASSYGFENVEATLISGIRAGTAGTL